MESGSGENIHKCVTRTRGSVGTIDRDENVHCYLAEELNSRSRLETLSDMIKILKIKHVPVISGILLLLIVISESASIASTGRKPSHMYIIIQCLFLKQ